MGNSQTSEPCTAGSLSGLVAIVTGANTGIGFEVAQYLCHGGCHVILACRNEERGNAAVTKIKNENPDAKATFMKLDLCDFDSVRSFADAFHASSLPLHILINNAGMSYNFSDKIRHTAANGLEMTMTSNHLGHFLLTHLLLDDLKKAATTVRQSRIVVLASSVHDAEIMKRFKVQPTDVEDFMLEKDGTYSGVQAYKNSKLANIMFTYQCAHRLAGNGVTINCLCPGFIPGSDFMRNASTPIKVLMTVMSPIMKARGATRTVQQGATDVFNLATSENYKDVSGKYFRNGVEEKSSDESYDETKQKQIWQLSEELLQMKTVDPEAS